MSKKSTSAQGITWNGLLALIFITLKLTHFITWSWWWVLSPIWIPVSIALFCFIIYGLIKLNE